MTDKTQLIKNAVKIFTQATIEQMGAFRGLGLVNDCILDPNIDLNSTANRGILNDALAEVRAILSETNIELGSAMLALGETVA